MHFKKIIGKVHLWLGLISGLLVFIIAVTGCMYTFQKEIQDWTQTYRFVEAENKPFLLPTQIQMIADKALPGKHIHSVMYEGKTKASQAIYFKYSEEEKYYYKVYINPYNGKVLSIKDAYSGFFHYILEGHFYLWLPHNIGQPVVAYATLVFLIMVLSGLYLWWKRKKNTSGQQFKIKWNARWRRKNYDLHNVLGFYITWIAILFAVTGLVWGFQWFAKGYYGLASGGKTLVSYYDPKSDTTASIHHSSLPAIDRVYLKLLNQYSNWETLEVHIPDNASSSISANVNPDASTYWKTDFRYFDQYTLKELSVNHMYNRFENISAGEKLMRMNYDIHTGAVLGLPGKIIAFFGSLVIASLPITGFLIWFGRKKKEKKQLNTAKYKLIEMT
jgi:uncharacterized iron-regulated membrane protein